MAGALYKAKHGRDDMTCPECKQMMQSPDTDYPYWFCFGCGAEVPDQTDARRVRDSDTGEGV